MNGWSLIDREAGEGRRARFELRAYSELMPPPYLLKPYGREVLAPRAAEDEHGFVVSELEEHAELAPGLAKIAQFIVRELIDFANKKASRLSKRITENNPAWPPELAARPPALLADPQLLMLPVALSKTQDDKGRVRWTLFGASHENPEAAFWNSFYEAPNKERKDAREIFDQFIAFAAKDKNVRILPGEHELPSFAKPLAGELESATALITFQPFAALPEELRQRYLEGRLLLLPSPATLLFNGHTGYRKLAEELPRAMQIPLLHLFPRSETTFGIRIPQSGWLDEKPNPQHHVVSNVRRTHRWQRVERDADDAAQSSLDDPVTVALFSSEPDDVGLYGKPMAKNAQIWTEHYRALLDGPTATRDQLEDAAHAMEEGDRFGYRFLFPAMMAGPRTIYWHRPLFARWTGAEVEVFGGHLRGYFTAERTGHPHALLWPRVLARPAELAALATRKKTAENVRKIFEWRALLDAPLPPSFARRLVAAPRDTGFEGWVRSVEREEKDPAAAAAVVQAIRGAIGAEPSAAELEPLTLQHTHTRAFEETYWKTIAFLAEGRFREKNNADFVLANAGRTGGKLAETIGRHVEQHRDLDTLGEYLHRYYAELIERHGMSGRAYSADHRFAWKTDFDFSWSEAWRKNQSGEGCERNIVVVIPGKNRGEAVIMGDHYDTAYMEDLYEPSRGGDRLRAAAAGADDNHSATAALMLAAEVLLPMSRAGALGRDVWLVHLTGEEFPCDCLGARALAQALVERALVLQPFGPLAPVDMSAVRVRGAFIMDMIAHNNDKKRDIFQIAPGEGRGSARLAWHAYLANRRWNAGARGWNKDPERAARGRSQRMKDGAEVPPMAEHLLLTGEVRPEWDPRSSLYNTDAQIFSDVGVPVVLLMENYDISREGYHDVHDTMENIDLDYGAALAAIAIESVASVASVASVDVFEAR